MNYNNIIYYNGKSSVSHKAELSLNSNGFIVNYIENNHLLSVKWQVDKIHKPEISSGDILTLRYGDKFPYQSIEIKDKRLSKKILEDYKLDSKTKKYSFFLENGVKGIAIGSIIFVGIFLFFYKIILPNAAETLADSVSISFEEKIGKNIKNALIAESEVDSVKTKALNRFYKSLDFKSPYNVDLTVVNAPIHNAFATSGGYIIIYSKIIDDMECPEELAALIGHELTHVNEKHTTKSIFRGLANYIALSVLLNDVNAIAAIIIDNADSINQSAYTRELEHEADEKALEHLYASNINPNGMVSLMEQLDELSDGVDIPLFLRTHPMTKDRISFSKNYIIARGANTDYSTPDWHEAWQTLKQPSDYSNTIEEKIKGIFKWPEKEQDSL